MALTHTDYYRLQLADVHRYLLGHPVSRSYLTGTGIRFDGIVPAADDIFQLPFGALSTLEFAHLFSVFDGSRVHQQAEKQTNRDDAPPGMYFTVVNYHLIQNQHKNKLGLIEEQAGTTGLFIEALYVDHYFLDERKTPMGLGTIAFGLCAITAHLAGLDHIALIAAGGNGFSERYVGFKVWPKLGFDASLLPGEVDDAPHLHHCQTVQDVLAVDPVWWERHGSQRRMVFDLHAHSISWRKMLDYLDEKIIRGGPHG